MKPTAFFINTSRGPIVDEKALDRRAQRQPHRRRGASTSTTMEPLPLDHPFRKMDNIVITPHLGYVTAENYRQFYGHMVEDIRAFLDGKPVRVIPAK